MFPKLQRKLVFLYTLSTGLIITFILSITFLFYFTSQENRQESLFQKHLFTLMFQLQGNSHFTDLFLAQMEEKNQLIIHIEENNSPLFFPGSYRPDTRREILFHMQKKLRTRKAFSQIPTLSPQTCCRPPYFKSMETAGMSILGISLSSRPLPDIKSSPCCRTSLTAGRNP